MDESGIGISGSKVNPSMTITNLGELCNWSDSFVVNRKSSLESLCSINDISERKFFIINGQSISALLIYSISFFQSGGWIIQKWQWQCVSSGCGTCDFIREMDSFDSRCKHVSIKTPWVSWPLALLTCQIFYDLNPNIDIQTNDVEYTTKEHVKNTRMWWIFQCVISTSNHQIVWAPHP